MTRRLTQHRSAALLLLCLLGPACQQKEPEKPVVSWRLPGEFEMQSAVAIGMAQLVQFHPEALVQIVDALAGQVRILGLVGSREEEQTVAEMLHAHGVDPYNVEFLLIPVDTMWARDFGPLFVQAGDSVRVVDAEYPGTELNPREDRVPETLARWLQLTHHPLPLLLEGGNVLGNGDGLIVTTTEVIRRNLVEHQLTREQTQALLARALGASHIAYLRPLEREATAHIDMFCVFTGVDQVVVASMDPALDAENAARLDEAAASLAGLPTRLGPLRVERLAMPPAQDGVWRSYTNILIADGVVLVPIYPNATPDFDRAALAFYTRLFPERSIAPIRAETMAVRGGTLHCVSFHVPRFVRVPPIGN